MTKEEFKELQIGDFVQIWAMSRLFKGEVFRVVRKSPRYENGYEVTGITIQKTTTMFNSKAWQKFVPTTIFSLLYV